MKIYAILVFSIISFIHCYTLKQLNNFKYIKQNKLKNRLPDLHNKTKILVKKPSSHLALKTCLLKSYLFEHEPKAIFNLGKFHLYQFPNLVEVSNEQQDEDIQFCSSYKENDKVEEFLNKYNDSLYEYDRNLQKALDYFIIADAHGYSDASLYMSFFLQQSLISQRFKSLFQIDYEKESIQFIRLMSEYLNNAAISQSELSNTYIFEMGRACFFSKYRHKSSQEKRIFQIECDGIENCTDITMLEMVDRVAKLIDKEYQPQAKLYLNMRLQIMNGLEKCPSCEELLNYGANAASHVLNFIQEKGGEGRQFCSTIIIVQSNRDVKQSLENLQNNKEKLEIIKQQADAGNHDAQLQLAEMYYFGNPNYGVEQNQELAANYFERVARDNNANGLYNLGILEVHTSENYTKAQDLFNRSAQLGHGEGYSGLGYLYLNGYGVEKNLTMALQMFEKGAQAGSIQSMTNAGVMYLEQGNRNVSKAIEYFLMAAKFNQTNAIFDLVLLHIQGYNTTKSCLELLQMMTTIFQHSQYAKYIDRGIEKLRKNDKFGGYLYFSLAKALGLSDQYILETLDDCALGDYCDLIIKFEQEKLEDEIYDLQDYELARKLYRIKGDGNALYSLSYMYEHGIGVQQSLLKAHELNNLIIKQVERKKLEMSNLVPAYLQKMNLWIKEYL